MQQENSANQNPLTASVYKSLIKSSLTPEATEKVEKIASIINESNKILIASHAAPDGDALGSSLAMAYMCESLKKEYVLYNETCPLPEYLNFLPKPKNFVHDLDELPFAPELILIFDCGDKSRIGASADKLLNLAPSINIDHHLGNPEYASLINWVDSSMAATGNMVAYLAFALRVPLDHGIITNIYTSLVTDTGSFTYSNTDSRVLTTAAFMVASGVVPSFITNSLDNSWSEEKTRLWAHLMGAYTFDKELEIGYVLVSQILLESLNCTKDDLEGFVEHLRKIKGVRIAFTVREKSEQEAKVSFRSTNDDNVQKLAMMFGGGGHKNAAAATLKQTIEEARDSIVDAIKKNKSDFLA